MSTDITLPFTAALSVAQMLAYAIFALWACRHPDPDKARRWRASILIGGLGTALAGLVIFGGLVSVGALYVAIENHPQLGLIILLDVARAMVYSYVGLSCLAMPLIFMATFGTYINFLQTGDYWLDRWWKKPGIAGEPSSSVSFR